MIQIEAFAFNPFQENTYILYDETKECVIIDPGCYTEEEKETLELFIKRNHLVPVKLLLTHAHIDHVLGNKFVYDTWNLKPIMHEKDLVTLTEMTPGAAKMYGIPIEASPLPESYIEEGDQVSFGNSSLDVLFTPGHAPGHVVFVHKEQKFIINGDVLFQGSIGRTDFPNCDHNALISSIQNKLFPLGDDFVVYTGHGNPTTIGEERIYNPFVGEKAVY